ncbi:MAG: RHS repeat-associated core domain-containing protein [Nitrosomonas sp.]|nr:RHS repeat-associated core domain-containing protein [Nitrosomonas sp.]
MRYGRTGLKASNLDKLVSSKIGSANHTYKYNALDQRISKNGPLSAKFSFFYDPAGQLIGEYKDNAATATPTDDWLLRQETVWLADIPVAVLRKPVAANPIQISYIHTDHLNTPRVIVNTNNTPLWRWDNVHAFGANLPDEDPDGNAQLFEYNPRFPGQYFDRETALHYNYFRYYEPETGRYISPDPIGLAGGLNTFGYTFGNPIKYSDPLGLDVVIALYEGQNGNVFNHIGIGTTTGNNANQTFGAGPDSGIGLFSSVSGHVRSDRGKPISTLIIPTTASQDALINIFNNAAMNNPNFRYSLLSNSCVDHVRNALNFSGINFSIPVASSKESYYPSIRGLATNLPNVLFKSLTPLGTVVYH